MRRSSWTPSIVPNDNDETVYLVADDFGRLGRAWREADYETTDLETVIQDLLTGQFANTAERWSEDVSEDVANELRRRCDLQMRELPSTISDFVERHEDRDRRQLTLRLAAVDQCPYGRATDADQKGSLSLAHRASGGQAGSRSRHSRTHFVFASAFGCTIQTGTQAAVRARHRSSSALPRRAKSKMPCDASRERTKVGR